MPWSHYPRETAPGVHWIVGWVGPKAALDMAAKRKTYVHVSYTVTPLTELSWLKA